MTHEHHAIVETTWKGMPAWYCIVCDQLRRPPGCTIAHRPLTAGRRPAVCPGANLVAERRRRQS